MSRIYKEEEKREHLDRFKVSGKTKTQYARENDIPEATFRAWVKEEQYGMFGELEITKDNPAIEIVKVKPIIYCDDKIRIELKEGYNKEFFKRMMEVLINDK